MGERQRIHLGEKDGEWDGTWEEMQPGIGIRRVMESFEIKKKL